MKPYSWFYLAAIFSNIFSGEWARFGIPVPVDRLLLLLAFAALVYSSDLKSRHFGTVVRLVAFPWFVGFALLMFGSAATIGTIDRVSLFSMLDRVLVPLAMYLVAWLFLPTPRSQRHLLDTLVLASAVVAAFALVGYATGSSASGDIVRAVGPSGEPVGSGLILVLGMAAGILRMSGESHRISPGLGLAHLSLVTSATALTLTRSVWLSAALALAIIYAVRPKLRRKILGGLSVGVAALVVALTLSPQVATDAQARLTTERSIDDRSYSYEAAYSIASRQPLTGVGWGNYLASIDKFVVQSDLRPLTTVRIEVHNVFLARLAELGVPGLVIWLGCVAGGIALPLVQALRRGWRDDITALASVAGVIWIVGGTFTGLSYPLPNQVTWALCGLVAIRLAQTGRNGATSAPPSGRRGAQRLARDGRTSAL